MNLSEYTIEQLVELKNEVENHIYSYEDGYFYICNVRSYGRNWKENFIKNKHTLQELCYRYNGDDGIVDVYSNNPDLGDIENYGDVKFVPTQEDYEKWYNYVYLRKLIPSIEKELEEWENRDNVPFNSRPFFKPFYTNEDIELHKKTMSELEGTFVEPKYYRL
jgi:hypothetical protein